MSGNRPSEEELRPGMTVEITQSNADNAPDAEPIRGEIRYVADEGETPRGVKVELKSGATGYVEQVVTE